MALSSQAPVRNQAVEHMCDFTQSYNPPSSCAACVTCKDNAPSGQECVVANSGRCVSRSSANISTANELCDSTDPFCRNCVNEWGSSAEICTGTGGCLCSSACAVAQCRPGTRAPLSGPVPVGTQLSGSSQRQTRALSIPAMIVLICLVVLALLALLWIGHYFRQRRRRLEREQLYERQQTPRAAPRSTRSGPTAPLALEGWTSMRRKLIEDEHARFGVGDEQSSSSGRVVEEATVTVEHGGSGRTHPVERGTWV
ncbi:TPA: hypothetical protein N0F65_008910 [Lagenidium giganteum]|uniref:TNFR-Cys domain-containing protein n=1 Tax=Lagenidium giganteum TaxID=4803 RepID=A0AAV2YWE6_9STRA|nr:TPA: hypothetical protein N0F65_008910 [Lagenidium giganteum]